MELVITRGAGLDVHQATVVATVRVPSEHGGRMSVTETFGTTTADLLALRILHRGGGGRHDEQDAPAERGQNGHQDRHPTIGDAYGVG